MLSDYSGLMIKPVFNNLGHPKKFMVDGPMALFDAVNLAPHPGQKTLNRGGDILADEYSHVAARSRFSREPVGEISIKGNARTYTTKPVL